MNVLLPGNLSKTVLPELSECRLEISCDIVAGGIVNGLQLASSSNAEKRTECNKQEILQ